MGEVMTGYKSKKAAALDKLEQWDTPSEAFNAWWNSDYYGSTNPYEINTFAYWAWAGWQAALAQPAQEPVQVSVEEFVHIVEDKEHLVGRPIVWAQWPSKEKNND